MGKKKPQKGKKQDDSDDEIVAAAPAPVAAKKGPAPKKKNTNAFVMSDDDSSSEEEVAKPQPKKKDTSAFNALASSDEDSEEEEEAPKPAAKGKKDTSAFNALASDSDSDSDEEEAPKPAAKGKKGGKKDTSAFLALADDDSEEEEEEEEEEEKTKPVEQPKASGGKKDKKKGKKGAKKDEDEDEDEDALLEAAMAANKIAEEKAGGNKKNNKKKGKGKGAQDDDDDEDALLEAAMAANAASAPAVEAEKPAEPPAAAEGEDGEEGEEGEGGGKKKRRGGKKKSGEEKKKSTQGSKIAEALRIEREREEARRLEEEAKLKAIEDEKRRLEEEAQKKAEEEAAKKAAKAAKRAEDKAAGLILTKKEREAKEAAARRRAKLEAMGMAPSADADKSTGKKTLARGGKNKGKGKNQPTVEEVTEAAAEEKEEEEKEPKPAAAGGAPQEEEEADLDWDADDLEIAEILSPEERAAKEKADKKAAELAKREAEQKEEEQKRLRAREAKLERQRRIQASEDTSSNELRSPICCIMGHVDTGKTKLLDKIRRTNVQDNEAGGITQQIGATYFPAENLLKATAKLREKHEKMQIKVPGLLIIDTPGHESFSNLRNRGSSLCDIAILVVDIMHGLEPQTLESLKMIRDKNVPFIVALNKIDRIFGWKEDPNAPFLTTLEAQEESAKNEFEQRLAETILLFNKEGLNAQVYYKNKDFKEFISLVPTSAITGEGIPDMLGLITQLCQKMIGDRIVFRDEIQATVLEVKVVEGHGTTIDIVLVNGELKVGDTICVCGLNGPIVTNIRALMTPQPMKEIRVKGTYQSHKKMRAAMGIKIGAPGLEGAIAGGQMLVAQNEDEIEAIKEEIEEELEAVFENDDRTDTGVYVMASTLGSLEALLSFLKDSSIPYSAVNIGPVHKKDVMKAAIQLEKNKDYACILAFDVKITPEAQDLADEYGMEIYWAEIIYHLFDQFTLRLKLLKEERREAAKETAVFPCALKIYEQHIFNARNPILVGVNVTEGQVRLGTPLCVRLVNAEGTDVEILTIGKIVSIQKDHKEVTKAVQGEDIAIKIEQSAGGQEYYYGRHFDFKDTLLSKISRESIDLLKANFKDDLEKEDWMLLKKLKPLFSIQ